MQGLLPAPRTALDAQSPREDQRRTAARALDDAASVGIALGAALLILSDTLWKYHEGEASRRGRGVAQPFRSA